MRQCSAYRQELTRLQVQYNKALEKCEKVIDSPSWQEKLEFEYKQLVETLNHWSELKQQWYQAKSEQLSTDWQEKFPELEAESLRQRYRLLKIELEGKRKSWQALLHTFTTLPAQSTQTV